MYYKTTRTHVGKYPCETEFVYGPFHLSIYCTNLLSMKVYNTFSEIDRTQWQELVVQSPTASFFQTPECYEFFSTFSFLTPFVFGVSENDKLVGILSGYVTSDGNIIKQYLSRRAIVSGGALLDISISQKALEKLLITATETLKRKAIYLEIRNYTDYSGYKVSFQAVGFQYTPHLNFHVATTDVDSSLMNLSTTRRREIKLSIKAGALWSETNDPEDVRTYYAILLDLYKTKVKTPLFPLEFFEKLVQQSFGKLFVIKRDNQIIGGSVCVVLSGRIIYEWFVCGLDGQVKNVFPSTIATWAAIEYAATNGYACFDMMGAGKPDDGYGVRDFKSKFGGDLVENGRFLYQINPFLFKIGKIAVRIMRFQSKKPKKTIPTKAPDAGVTIEKQIQKINTADWSDFVKKHPNGNIFQKEHKRLLMYFGRFAFTLYKFLKK